MENFSGDRIIKGRKKFIQYRKLPKGAEKISVLGIGTSSIQASSEKKIEEIMDTAIENGINFFDMVSSEAKPFAPQDAAGKCVHCGHCNSRCPFHVVQVARMQEIVTYFNH